MNPQPQNRFEQQSARKQRGFVVEFWDFIRHNKKWWLTPVIVLLLVCGLLVVLSGSGLAPFIYTLF